MYKVTKRDCPMFGIGPYVCEFICDTASDIATLPTSISEGTGGKTVHDNQKCASGSIANVADNGAESKQYMLNNQDIWCPYSVAAGSSDSVLEEAKAYTDSEIADLINGAPTTLDTLKEISDAMAENQTVVEALDAAIGTKANKTDIPTELPANGGNADTVNGHSVNADVPADAVFTDTVPDLSLYALKSNIPTKTSELENDSGFLTEHQDLSAYAKTADLNTTVSSINTTLDTKANKTDIPTKVSQLENDSGYLTEHQDLSEYAKTAEVPGIKVNSAVNADTVNGHTVNADVPADAKFTDTVPDLTPYALKSKYGDTTINVGRKADTMVGDYSTAEGYNTTASGVCSHAEGQNTTASEDCAHAEGWKTAASGKWSHAEGQDTTASGIYSHAEGYETTASGIGSHASGIGTQALHRNEAAYGTFNESNDDTLFSVGDGTADDARHNAFEITTSGGKLHDKDIATADLIPIIKSIEFSAATTNGYIWTGIAFPKYVIGVDLGHFDIIVQFYKGNHTDAGRAEWAMKFFNMNDVTTPLNGSFNGTIYYIG